ncbi:MAG: TM2 domain-containing protein [Methylococcaceae bacterium]|nr:TM2 domain-containing protein [Methylococcaceae bacterium]
MIGHIDSYNPESQSGVIKTDGKSFAFHTDDWVSDVAPDVGDDVIFVPEGEIAREINLAGACLAPPKEVKNKYLAAVLALVLGWAGAHRFYLGFYQLGVIQLVLTVILYVTGFPGFAFLWAFVESILLVTGNMNKDAKGRPIK